MVTVHKHKDKRKVHPLNLFSGFILSISEFVKINHEQDFEIFTHNIAGKIKSSKSQY